jgi:hypothetical protein
MPLFYFDLHEGGELRDEEGSECADLEAACDLAVMYARDIAAEHGRGLTLASFFAGRAERQHGPSALTYP